MFKFLAKPLPDPVGIIAKVVDVFINPLAISFTEPSPPTATIVLYFEALFLLISIACLALFVYSIVISNLLRSSSLSINCSIDFCFPTPEKGLIINSIFFLEIIGLIFRQVVIDNSIIVLLYDSF